MTLGEIYTILPWREIYGAAAFSVAALAWWRNRIQGRIAAALVCMSWLVTTITMHSEADDKFLIYFSVDVTSYIVILPFVSRWPRSWAYMFAASLFAHMNIQWLKLLLDIPTLHYWEIANSIYIFQMWCAIQATKCPKVRRFKPLPPRTVTKEDVERQARMGMSEDPRYTW